MYKQLSSLVPDRLFCSLVSLTYTRFEPESSAVAKALPKNSTAIDIGTWYGPWSRRLAKNAKKVISFEANPAVYGIVSKHLPNNVEIHNNAVSNFNGKIKFAVAEQLRGGEGTSRVVGDSETSQAVVEVDCVSIDSLNLPTIDFMKIDVEGHEIEVLEGALTTIKNSHPVMMVEIEDRHGDVVGSFRMLEDLGYETYLYQDRKWVPITPDELIALQQKYVPHDSLIGGIIKGSSGYANNVLFVHPDSSWNPLHS